MAVVHLKHHLRDQATQLSAVGHLVQEGHLKLDMIDIQLDSHKIARLHVLLYEVDGVLLVGGVALNPDIIELQANKQAASWFTDLATHCCAVEQP
jgi:hypothetical protein